MRTMDFFTWSKISGCIKRCIGDRPARVWLFGSQARGEARRGSDIDMAIESTEDISYEISLLREALEELDIAYNVDVVDMRLASGTLVEQIRRDGIEWAQLAKDLS